MATVRSVVSWVFVILGALALVSGVNAVLDGRKEGENENRFYGRMIGSVLFPAAFLAVGLKLSPSDEPDEA